MTTRQRNGTILAVILLAAVVAFVKSGALDGPKAAPTVLDAVPTDAFVVLTLDVPALRASPLADALAPLTSALGGADQVKKVCGFDPFDRVRSVAVALPQEASGDFGVILRGAIPRDELVDCAKKAITARGGSPAVGPDAAHPDFLRVRDGATLGSVSAPEIVIGPEGPVLLGRGAWLDKMVAAAAGAAPSVRTNTAHMDLRRALGAPTADGDGSSRSAVLTVLLPTALRTRLKGEMAEDGGLPGSMQGVLGVESAGLALTAGDAGGTTDIAVELRCESPNACDEVDHLVATKRATWSHDFTLRFLGLGPLIDGMTVEKKGAVLDAHVALPADDAGRLVAKLVAIRQGRVNRAPSGLPSRGNSADPATPTAPPPLPKPDEVVRPRR